MFAVGDAPERLATQLRANEKKWRAEQPEWNTPQLTILKEIKSELIKLRLIGVAAVAPLAGLLSFRMFG